MSRSPPLLRRVLPGATKTMTQAGPWWQQDGAETRRPRIRRRRRAAAQNMPKSEEARPKTFKNLRQSKQFPNHDWLGWLTRPAAKALRQWAGSCAAQRPR
ncbi:hypothetical protein MTO96_013903 [Rhipicephalus appendiculatus]